MGGSHASTHSFTPPHLRSLSPAIYVAPSQLWRVALFIVLAVAFVTRPGSTSAGVNLWTSIGPEGGDLTALAIDPLNPATLYAGDAFYNPLPEYGIS